MGSDVLPMRAREKIMTRFRTGKFDLSPYLFILPSLLIMIAFLIFPIARALQLSLTNTRLLEISKARFNGLDNYRAFFSDPSFGRVVFATLTYVVAGVSLTYLLGLFTASIVNQSFKGKSFARTILILPWVVPSVVLVIIWKWMLNSKFGVINFFLNQIKLVPLDFSWLSSPQFAMAAIIFATIWKQYPLGLLILLAGMQSISRELYEAASVDGATSVQKFFHITIPGLRYVTTVLILLLTIWHFGNFVIIWLMTRGGPSDITATFTIFTYLTTFKFHKLGMGASIGAVIFLVSLIFAAVYYALFVRKLVRI
jgi:multiple sugar transport system permease protein